MEESKKKFVELDILRVIAILPVVIGHCSCLRSESSLGSLADTSMIHEPIYEAAAMLLRPIYCFHMPLFFALSGICYALNEHLEQSPDKFTWKKMQSLMVPLFLVGSLYMIPILRLAKFYPDNATFFLAETKLFEPEITEHLRNFHYHVFYFFDKFSMVFYTGFLLYAFGLYLDISAGSLLDENKSYKKFLVFHVAEI